MRLSKEDLENIISKHNIMVDDPEHYFCCMEYYYPMFYYLTETDEYYSETTINIVYSNGYVLECNSYDDIDVSLFDDLTFVEKYELIKKHSDKKLPVECYNFLKSIFNKNDEIYLIYNSYKNDHIYSIIQHYLNNSTSSPV